ncbi:amidohydrolase family protein [Eudoraea chungangensis]|uniref:amidohydrolase family protein n=1 Tax=Eudoraea chungangensis TaxID=1481905 RepID=UPI0023EC8976|nr:DUF6090 family protein [Eudoraea chungangensis]
MENKTGKYLKYAIGEIILVVIGILIALQINNWNEYRKDRIREQAILKNLQIDFQTNIKNVNDASSNFMVAYEASADLLEITELAQQNGVKVLAGTDALDRNVYYGISIHEELQEMVKAGLSNAEALKTATLYPVEYYNINNDYGSIEAGKIADFIMLDKDPLVNIEHTQTIRRVHYNGRLYNSADLEQMKLFVKNQAKSFGITCKFIWNMIKRN